MFPSEPAAQVDNILYYGSDAGGNAAVRRGGFWSTAH